MSDRMTGQQRLAAYVETWHRACTDFVTLARTLTEDEVTLPTDLPGWSVHDNVAHTAHLEAVLAGAPEETLDVPDGLAHVRGPMHRYTEQGVLARRDRTVAELADEIESAVATRYAALRADPPVDGSSAPPRTPGGAPWDNETLLANRPLDVWMHEQDIRRAIGRPGGYDSPAAAHTLRRLGASLPMVLGKRVAPPAGTSVLIEVPEASCRFGARMGDDGRAIRAVPEQPTVRVSLTPEAFVVLAGGRRGVDAVEAAYDGDEELGRRLLTSMAVTP
ncbi:maleylpyruvate isomerase family mycothiol-dependent enzyme [Nocardioides terrisoli]|uniref:maleylpyruvate isomerase family mycothiol-dependent enzyme n=1 Tax=Nocardioides terrisoli TaxID=3388267 RepID=UPI00287B7557|nr:maleylpyruvate isomerase family mycothiol-dependent enzyme [Nocardioides marmorisolisilvae]